MKLLLLLQGSSPQAQPGYHQAFIELQAAGALDGYACLPYLSDVRPLAEHWPALQAEALSLVREQGYDLLLLQCFHGPLPDPRPLIEQARRLNPHLLVLVSCGDPYGRWLQRPPASLLQAAQASDLVFSTSMGSLADSLIARGGRNIVLMPHGVCTERFSALPAAPASPDFDLVFVGSNNGGRNPFTPLSRAGRLRRTMVQALERRHGRRFGLFGHGWQGHVSWQGPVPYAAQQTTVQRSRLQLGGFPGSTADYYLSDRPFIAMASGVPLLDCEVPRVGALFLPGQHWMLYEDVPSLCRLAERMLDWDPAKLASLGQAARERVLERHTQAHRAREMLDIARSLAQARAAGRRAPAPMPRCLAPEADLQQELPHAVRAWRG